MAALALAVAAIFWRPVNAAPAASQPSGAGVSFRAIDLKSVVHPIGLAATRPAALVFLGTECPISRRYIPVLNDLAKSSNVELLGVISDPSIGRATADQFVKEYSVSFPVLLDA